MLHSLARVSARTATKRTEYICLSCRATAQWSGLPQSQWPSIPPDVDLMATGGRATIERAFEEAVRLMDKEKRREYASGIDIQPGPGDSYIARITFDGQSIQVEGPSKRIARTSLKRRIVDHLRDSDLRAQFVRQQERLFSTRCEPAPGTSPLPGKDTSTITVKPTEEKGDAHTSMSQTSHPKSKRAGVKSTGKTRAQRLAERRSKVAIVRRVYNDSLKAQTIHADAESSRTTRTRSIEKAARRSQLRGRSERVRLERQKIQQSHFEKNTSSLRSISRQNGDAGLTPAEASENADTPRSRRRTKSALAETDETRKSGGKLKSSRPSRATEDFDGLQAIHPLQLEAVSLDVPTPPVPTLSYGLDRVLFNPGVYHVQDPRSRVYNFDPYLEKIIDPKHFDFAVLDEFRSPSADNTLSTVAEEQKARFFSSTSAITGVLTHLHFLLSHFRPLSFDNLSAGFFASKIAPKDPDMATKGDFTKFFKSPQSIYLKPKQGGYAIDKAEDKSNIHLLSFVGQCLEKLFTVPKETFELYKKGSKGKPEPMPNGYHYTKFDDILIRSQLDAKDDRLPGTGIFDIKTRAVLPIRMDTLEANQELAKNYEIKHLYGMYESFEREFYDMGRATMIKYSLQARLGRMDGIFVAYHNIARLFGFQYLTLSDMDQVLHGQSDTTLGDAELSASLRILSEILDRAVKAFPGEALRLSFEARKGKKDMRVFVYPVDPKVVDEQYAQAQRLSKEYMARLTRFESLGLDPTENDLVDDVASDGGLQESTAVEDDSWINTKTPASREEIKHEEPASMEEIRDELERLNDMATKIRKETKELHKGKQTAGGQKIQKMILASIVRETFVLEKETQNLVTTMMRSEVESEDEDSLRELQNVVIELKDSNQSLLEAAEERKIVTGAEIKDLTNTRTLEEVLKAAAQRHVPPERLISFKVTSQSRVDGIVLDGPPTNITKDSDWKLNYKIEQIEDQSEANHGYVMMVKSQEAAPMSNWSSTKLRDFYEGSFFRNLMSLSRDGKKWRSRRDKEDREREVVVFDPRR